jgi:hypothetical protein
MLNNNEMNKLRVTREEIRKKYSKFRKEGKLLSNYNQGSTRPPEGSTRPKTRSNSLKNIARIPIYRDLKGVNSLTFLGNFTNFNRRPSEPTNGFGSNDNPASKLDPASRQPISMRNYQAAKAAASAAKPIVTQKKANKPQNASPLYQSYLNNVQKINLQKENVNNVARPVQPRSGSNRVQRNSAKRANIAYGKRKVSNNSNSVRPTSASRAGPSGASQRIKNFFASVRKPLVRPRSASGAGQRNSAENSGQRTYENRLVRPRKAIERKPFKTFNGRTSSKVASNENLLKRLKDVPLQKLRRSRSANANFYSSLYIDEPDNGSLKWAENMGARIMRRGGNLTRLKPLINARQMHIPPKKLTLTKFKEMLPIYNQYVHIEELKNVVISKFPATKTQNLLLLTVVFAVCAAVFAAIYHFSAQRKMYLNQQTNNYEPTKNSYYNNSYYNSLLSAKRRKEERESLFEQFDQVFMQTQQKLQEEILQISEPVDLFGYTTLVNKLRPVMLAMYNRFNFCINEKC